MEDEYLMKCVVDPVKRTFYLYSNEGDEKKVDCETVEQFMDVLKLCREVLPDIDEDLLVYTDPVVKL